MSPRSDNHDNPRFLNVNGDHALYMSALLYSMYSEGIPIVYYGSEQVCECVNAAIIALGVDVWCCRDVAPCRASVAATTLQTVSLCGRLASRSPATCTPSSRRLWATASRLSCGTTLRCPLLLMRGQ